MRKSELLILRWVDVDIENYKIKVTNAKNKEARVIPINQTLFQELSTLPRRTDKEHIFSDQNGHHVGDFKTAFSAAMRRAGIEDFHFHDLRHTFGGSFSTARSGPQGGSASYGA